MQGISSNLPQILQLNQFSFQVNNPVQTQQPDLTAVSGNLNQDLLNDIASLSAGAVDIGSLFDNTMNDIASYKDIISSAQDSLSKIKGNAVDIKSIIAQAQQGGLSQDLISQLQADVDSKILDINLLKDAANSEGVNPYNGAASINIPSFKSFSSGVSTSSDGGMNTYNLDLAFEMDGVSFSGSANIKMGTAEDGSFQFAFDVTLDYDLSSIAGEGGITSDNAMDVINNFISVLGQHEGTLGQANSFMDAVFEKIFETMGSAQPNADNINGYDSSEYLKNQIVQQSSSTLNSIMMNQMPGLALNLI